MPECSSWAEGFPAQPTPSKDPSTLGWQTTTPSAGQFPLEHFPRVAVPQSILHWGCAAAGCVQSRQGCAACEVWGEVWGLCPCQGSTALQALSPLRGVRQPVPQIRLRGRDKQGHISWG